MINDNMYIVPSEKIKIKELLNKLMFDDKIPKQIRYFDKITKKYDYMFVNKEDFMKCLENGVFELDDEIEIQKWYIYETDDNGNILELLEEIE